MMMKMSKAEYAKHRGISKPAVSKLIRNNRVMLFEDGKVDVEASDLILDNFANESQGKTRKNENNNDDAGVFAGLEALIDGGMDYNTGRSLLTHYTAELKRLELEEKQGKSLPADIVCREAFECARRVRDGIFAIEDRVADILAAETNRDKIKALLNQEHRIVLNELSNMPEINKRLGATNNENQTGDNTTDDNSD